ncbi:MAG: AAA family ATPase [Nanoarchaeota archaeon]|nr:AAA family ATPase [Nanoarchaeota archaeon]
MLQGITIKNFRSAESVKVNLAPLTIFYGPTSSGKSNLLYAFLVLRNFVLNPNRQADGFFHLGFMDLGGFEACVFNHDTARSVEISLEFKNGTQAASYGVAFSKASGNIVERFGEFQMEAQVNLPYGLNQTFPFVFGKGEEEYSVNWNGITCSVAPKTPTAENQQRAQEIATLVNKPSEVLRAIDIAPHRRGFFKPNYTTTPVSPTPTNEDEVASFIINDQYLPGRISNYTEEIFGRDFRIHVPVGTATAFFHSTDKKSRIPVFLVNDGFGVNQVIYMLAKMLRIDVNTILIEEPEVHLHPTVLRSFARALCSFVKDEGKQIVLTTHSEQFLAAILTAVADDFLKPEDIRCHLTSKDKKATSFEEQKVGKDGQIEGGLTSFVEAEIEDLRRFLSVK